MINGLKPNRRYVYFSTYWGGRTWDEEIPNHLNWTVSYYTQKPSERLRRLLERISFKRPLRYDDIEQIMTKWLGKNVSSYGRSSVYRSAHPANYVIGLVNGKYIYNNKFGDFYWPRTAYFEYQLKIENPKTFCRWCGVPIYKKLSFYWGAHCSKRNCRELNAVYEKKHQIIKLSRKDLLCTDKGYFYETQKLQFIAAFLERKAKWMQRQAKLKEQAAV